MREVAMAVITISRGSYSKGREVAKEVARRLDYECVAREVFVRASEQFNIPEVKFAKAIHDAPSIFDRLTYGREKFIAYFRSALLQRLQRDNVVYHGLAGHFFVKGVAHALKVRIIADFDERVRTEMTREGLTAETAAEALRKDDEERRKWSQAVYGIDTTDPSLYDLVIHAGKIGVEGAVDIICLTAGFKAFQTTFESQKALDELVMAASVKAALIELKPDIEVMAKDGNVIIGTRSTLIQHPEVATEMEAIAKSVSGVKSVQIRQSHLVSWTD